MQYKSNAITGKIDELSQWFGNHKQVTVRMENGVRKLEIRSNTGDGEGVVKLDAYEFRHLKDIEETVGQMELFFHQVCIFY